MSTPAAPHPIRLSMLDTPFLVHGSDEAALAEVRRVLAPFVTRHREPAARVVHLGRGAGPAGAFGELMIHLNATALSRADCLAVHAGVVARDGRVAAFPGGSGAGKSTLVAACLLVGLDYVSDEALCLSWPDGAVLRYPRPLALSGWATRLLGVGGEGGAGVRGEAGDGDEGREHYLTATELSAEVAAEPLTLTHVVLLDRQDGVSAGLRPTGRREVAAALLERSFTHWKRPERAFELAHEMAGRAEPWQLTLGDPRAAAALVAGLLTG